MSRPPALFPTSPRYILKPFSMALPSWANVPVVDTARPILIGPPAAALAAGFALAAALAAPDAAGLADALAAALAAGLALAAALGGAAALAGFGAALEAGAADGAAPPPQAASARVV